MENLGECHDLCLKSDTLFLADVFKNFKRIRLKIFQLDPVEFFSGLWLAWKAAFKKGRSKIIIINWDWYA